MADELFHLRQRVVSGADGVPELTTSDGNGTATYVNWVQPAPFKTDIERVVGRG